MIQVTLWSEVFPTVGTRKNQGNEEANSALQLTHLIVLSLLALMTLWLGLCIGVLGSSSLQCAYSNTNTKVESHTFTSHFSSSLQFLMIEGKQMRSGVNKVNRVDCDSG